MSSLLRKQQLEQWLQQLFVDQAIYLQPLTGDAGFRIYYRLQLVEQNFIVVDSPVDKINNLAFVGLAHGFARQNIQVPEIIHYDQANGFICITDFGDTLLSHKLNPETMPTLYQQAIALLPNIQKVQPGKGCSLAEYDQPFLQMELDIFSDWLLQRHLHIQLSKHEQQQLQQCFDLLISSAIEQPQVTVHRDFHSRNIMFGNDGELAVIDFQDAVIGPFTYDLVSLLRDCYVRWDDELIAPLLNFYVEQIQQQSSLTIDGEQFQRWFDLMGLQRHIKASGIFARLYHRDAKPGYLNDIPLTLSYIVDIAAKYPELMFLSDLVKHKVLPGLAKLAERQQAGALQ
ncbi:aminoglycoside phosphotransferase family protein [Thalassotalea sp. ND16A]|uniref:aminoglycoside phosphotransferase family protein n=1 Tax=Thalassotalea sp. ND16A TaxID=1535422 RepID=UPI00051CC6ED|nr:phosphotransferase [Thalassotalea sp. ND16A]KGK00547.1 hypothetical protein ND16A_3307 [Thalassotalea sp. ND16A]